MTQNNQRTGTGFNLTITRKQAIIVFIGMFITGLSIFNFNLSTPYNYTTVGLTTLGAFGIVTSYLSKYTNFTIYYKSRYMIFSVFTAILGTVLVVGYGLPVEIFLLGVVLLSVLSVIPFLLSNKL